MRWLPAAAYVVANWYVSDLPGERIGRLPAPDWLLHGAANALFGVALQLALAGSARALVAALVLVAGHGAVDEWHQSWVPGRSPSWTDWLADVAGGMAGFAGAQRLWSGLVGRVNATRVHGGSANEPDF